MSRNLPIFLSLLLALAINSFAQAPVSLKLSASTDGFDPLGLLEDDESDVKKELGVKPTAVAGEVERRAFDLINKERAKLGLPQLSWSNELVEVARMHSQSMAEFRFFSHRGLDNKLVSDRADALRVGKWRAIGENIAYNRGFADPVEKAVALWLDSPSHRRNMLDADWKESAVGIAIAADGSYYFTNVFLIRK